MSQSDTARRHLFRGLLGLLAIVLSRRRLAAAQEPGILTIDLNQWQLVRVKHGAHVVEIPTATIFSELARENTS